MFIEKPDEIDTSMLSIVFSQLNIQGIKSWNDMTDTERYEIIKPGE